MKQKLINIGIILALGFLMPPALSYYNKKEPTTLKLRIPEYLYSNNPEKDLMSVLKYYNVEFPEIVYSQAVLESGHFKSRIFKKYNNLFGLYDSKHKRYYKFNTWQESVLAYKNYVQRKYSQEEDYYSFLKNLPYAEDPRYINKIKHIQRRYFKC